MSELFNQSVLILGGARSGKSALAQKMIRESGLPAIYLATGVITDQEMEDRVRKHRASRPRSWQTYEVPSGFQQIEDNWGGKGVLLDCVTFLVNNFLLKKEKEEAAFQGLIQEFTLLLDKQTREQFYLLIVSNETGMGIVPEYPLARVFRDLQGRINQWLATRVNQVYLVVAGIPWKIKDERL